MKNLDSIFKFDADSHRYFCKRYRQSKNQDVEGWEVNVRKCSGILNKSISQANPLRGVNIPTISRVSS